MALPDSVRARGLAVFMSAFMGSMALGSLFWGNLAAVFSIDFSLLIAAIGAVVAVPITWRWRVSGAEDLDLSPSMHWPSPPAVERHDRGPVLVTIEYNVQAERVPE